MSKRLAKKVLLIGWDAADWKIIKPLLDAGRMPILNQMIEQGVMGNLQSMKPMVSPMLWTTIATGKRPSKHGILGFTEPTPSGDGVRPVTSTSRTCKAIWNILTQEGFKTHVVGWFGGHPAEPINGVCISEMFGKPTEDHGDPSLLAPGTIHPISLAETIRELQVQPEDFVTGDLKYFVPELDRIDQSRDPRLGWLARILAECGSVHAVATWVLENQAWDFAAIYYKAIDQFCHQYMYYHPPRMNHIPEEDYELYKNVIQSAYCFHDLMLGRLLQLAGEDTTVILVSDHGYHSDHLRPVLTGAEPGGPVDWHRPLGICVLKGPHLRKDELLFGARILDVTPTILTLFGLPIGEDMDGRPWQQALEKTVQIDTIPSWDRVPGECGMHAEEMRGDPSSEQLALRQLVELGYVEDFPEDVRAAVDSCLRQRKYYLALSFLDAGQLDKALPLLEELHAEQPHQLRIALELANCYLALNRLGDCRRIVEYLAAGNCYEKGAESPETKIVPQINLLHGLLEFNEGNLDRALEHLQQARQKLGDRHRGLERHIGEVYLSMGRWGDAEEVFQSSLAKDSEDAGCHHGLAVALLEQGKNEEAADHALDAVALHHHRPLAHFVLGKALKNMGDLDRAAQAFQVCLSMAPRMAPAHKELAELHSLRGESDKSATHKQLFAQLAGGEK